jgi:hypothetical protein
MSKLKLYLVIALLVVLAYVLLKKPTAPQAPSTNIDDRNSNDPYKYAEDTLNKLSELVAQKFPTLQQGTDQARQEAEQMINQVNTLAAQIQQQYREETPVLLSDNAVPYSPSQPSSVFESINTPQEPTIDYPVVTVKEIQPISQVIEAVQTTLVSPYIAPTYDEPAIETPYLNRERFFHEYQLPQEV